MRLLAALLVGSGVLYFKRLCPAAAKIIDFKTEKTEYREKIDINTAGKEELVKIKGIGPVLAGRIISHRKESGRFLTKEEIKAVKGIGDKTYEKIKGNITVE